MFKQILSFFIMIIILTSCGDKKKEPLSKELASIISHTPAEIIEKNSPVQIRFNQPIADEEQINTPFKEEIFHFNPEIKGKAVFQNQYLLVFEPDTPFHINQTYEGRIQISKISKSFKDLPDYSFQFKISARKINYLEHKLTAVNIDDPNILIIQGEISFSEPIEIEIVQKNITIEDRDNIQLQWKLKDQNSFQFQSSPIQRSNEKQILTVLCENSGLKISQTVRETIIIPPIQELSLEKTQIITEKNPRINLIFTEDLSLEQNIAGYIKVTNSKGIPLPVTLQKLNRVLYVDGPFLLGEKYEIEIFEGIKGELGGSLKKTIKEKIQFNDYHPEIVFNEKGCFLPTKENKKILFKVVNIKQVHLEINKVYENNLCFFLQEERLSGNENDYYSYSPYLLNRIGDKVFDSVLVLSNEKNRWLQYSLDLKKMIPQTNDGLFIIKLNFEWEDMLYNGLEEKQEERYYYGDDYYNNPLSRGYIYKHGRIQKPLIITDIGLTYKKIDNNILVISNDILSSQPLAGVNIKLMSYQNQIIHEMMTNEQGLALFENVQKEVFYIQGERNHQRSIVKIQEMKNNLSTFEISGARTNQSNLNCFCYTDRGVYIPGDTSHFSLILRNSENTYPEDQPIKMTIQNPKNQIIAEEIKKGGKDGFYHFSFKTDENSYTGTWRANIHAGNSIFTHPFKVETIIPYRLKVKIELEKKHLIAADNKLNIKIKGEYLIGNPCSGLNSSCSIDLFHKEKKFNGYQDFQFSNQVIDFHTINIILEDLPLNQQGERSLTWELPFLFDVPSSLEALITGEVFEKNGRPVPKQEMITIDPFPFYIGIKKPESKWGNLPTDEELTFQAICLSDKGKPLSGKKINWKLYHNNSYWWWEFNEEEEFRKSFKSSKATELIEEGVLISQETVSNILLKLKKRGEYLLELETENENNHKSSVFFEASAWGAADETDESDIMTIRTDKEKYFPGEKAIIHFPAPQEGSIFYSVENNEKILLKKWLNPEKDNEFIKIVIPIEEIMAPNVYFSIFLLLFNTKKKHDRPIRLYGMTPIFVENKSSKEILTIHSPEKIEPESNLKIKLTNESKTKTQYTIAIVDEGLLNITNYQTPNPWNYFYQKQGYFNDWADNYSHIMGVQQGDIFRTFSIGGGLSLEEQYRQSQMDLRKGKKSLSVSLFRGPIMSDNKGKAEIEIPIPDYTGSLRIMAVSANKGKYGSEEKNITVSRDFSIYSYLPKNLSPKEETVFLLSLLPSKEKIGEVELTLETTGPIRIIGENRKTLVLNDKKEKTIQFTLVSLEEIGDGIIEITAKSENLTIHKKELVPVRSSSPRIYHSSSWEIEKGKTISIKIPEKGVNGSLKGNICIQKKPNLNINHRIQWLTKYPYGCLEQTVSTVFPQLILYQIPQFRQQSLQEFEENINKAIDRLRIFQTGNGNLSYWPGGSYQSEWASAYAYHFLSDAKKNGFFVPDLLFSGLEKNIQLKTNSSRNTDLSQIYRLFLLAMNDKPLLGPMNFIFTNYINSLSKTELSLLAGAYYYSGEKNKAYEIIKLDGKEPDSHQWQNTYGSLLRDESIRLYISNLMNLHSIQTELNNKIGKALSSSQWYSTQAISFSLLALKKTLIESAEDQLSLKGNINNQSFQVDNHSIQLDLNKMNNKELKLDIHPDSEKEKAYVYLNYSYLPLRGEENDYASGIMMKRTWYDESGRIISIGSLPSNTAFWCHIRVWKNKNEISPSLENIALTNIFPSGWEMENPRIVSRNYPLWSGNFHLNEEEYMDIREDRVITFFSLKNNYKDFLFRINTTNKGKYYLPAVIAEDMYDHTIRAQVSGQDIEVY